MRIKVYNGTVSHSGHSLCDTCRHATITRGRSLEEEIVRCHAHPMGTIFIRFKVTECTAYIDASMPTYAQLLEQAWILGRARDDVTQASCGAASLARTNSVTS
jgi:hypothetical protein